MKTGIDFIKEERERQLNVEGWSSEHDDKYLSDELARAAATYAIPINAQYIFDGAFGINYRGTLWPFDKSWYKPSPEDRIKELSKSGALIAAEIDRLNRLTLRKENEKS
jgi:hypothetical protein